MSRDRNRSRSVGFRVLSSAFESENGTQADKMAVTVRVRLAERVIVRVSVSMKSRANRKSKNSYGYEYCWHDMSYYYDYSCHCSGDCFRKNSSSIFNVTTIGA